MTLRNPWAVAWILLAVAAVPLRAQELVAIEPARVEEGRPVHLRIRVRNGAEDPVALDRCAARLGTATAAISGSALSARSLLPFAHEAVSLELEVSEDLGPIARAPRPPLHGHLEGEVHRLLRVVAAAGEVALELDWIPAIDDQGLRLEWAALVLDEAALAECYVRGAEEEWTPAFGGEEAGAPAGRPRTAFRVRLVRWVGPGGEPPAEVLLADARIGGLTRLGQDLEVKKITTDLRRDEKPVLEVLPAAFGLAAARGRIGDLVPTAAVRLSGERWILEVADHGWWIVAPQGEPVAAEGRIFPLALALAREGRASFVWYGQGAQRGLDLALMEGGFLGTPGKGVTVEVTADRLAEFAAVLAKHGARLDGEGIAGR